MGIKNKEDAIAVAEKCQTQMDLAIRLTTSLASENERWADNVVKLDKDLGLIVGDVLLASAFVS